MPLARNVLFALWTSAVGNVAGQSDYHSDAGEAESLDSKLITLNSPLGHVLDLEDDLEVMYESLPKNSYGKLDKQTARYALHRFFLRRSGWAIHGLEPHAPNMRGRHLASAVDFEELSDVLCEETGVALPHMTVFAALIDEMIKDETAGRLDAAYRRQSVAKTDLVDVDEATAVLDEFYADFMQQHHGTRNNRAWFDKMLKQMRPDEDDTVSADVVEVLANSIGEQYHTFAEPACQELRHFLQQGEGKKPGRIRLSQFYKLSSFKTWFFTESRGYLRDLGALDESDPSSPYVITSNYVLGLQNCDPSSGIYSHCCQNQCEDLMTKVEQHFRADLAAPARIADFVIGLSSASVRTPRIVSDDMMRLLNEIADHHDGEVPIHGRLFAQWMHRMFPHECPYPQEAGSMNAQFPEDWMSSTGLNSSATPEEIAAHIEQDTEVCNESADIAWSPAEELFAVSVERKSRTSQRRKVSNLAMLVSISVLIWRFAKLHVGEASSSAHRYVKDGISAFAGGSGSSMSACVSQPMAITLSHERAACGI